MSFPQIKLDERSFQDLVDEAKLRIPRYTPEWTNHNVSDPGVTLIELFAYMVEQMLYQLNRVPEKNYRAFLEMIGVKLAPPNPAQAEVTFRLSASQLNAVTIPKGTEVATVRTETQPAHIFTTDEDLVIVPPKLKYILTTPNSKAFTDLTVQTLLSRTAQRTPVFQSEPQPGNAFYLGFEQNIARNTIVVGLDCEREGVGVRPDDAPLVWEYWDVLKNDWQALRVARDNSEGLTAPFAEIEFYLPPTAGPLELEVGSENFLGWWVRCRYTPLESGQDGYNLSPVIRRFSTYAIGGTIPARHSQRVLNEELGRSNGEPGQLFKLENTPILPMLDANDETILVDKLDGTAPELWKLKPDFSESGPEDKHFTCDPVSGEIAFGPIIRSPNGQEEQRGAIPPYNSRIVVTAYRTGGGTEGNVGSETITVLKTSIPYVDRVFNLTPATGGTNAENLEHALLRGPRTLRARNRAVTAEDFEVLTREATSGVARVRCLTPGAIDRTATASEDEDLVEPGTVVLVVVPEVDPNVRELRPENLDIAPGMALSITNYLDERRLLSTHVELTTPKYQWVTIQVRIKTLNPYVNERVKNEAERRLYQFLRPLQGGPDPTLRYDKNNPGDGWPFGRVLYASEIYPILQTIEGVEYVPQLELFPVLDLARGQAGPATQIIKPGPRGLLCSYRHKIIIV